MSVAVEEQKRHKDSESRIQEKKEQSGGVRKGSGVKGFTPLTWSSQSRASLDTAQSSGLEKYSQVG